MSMKKNKSKKGQPTPQTVTAEIDYDKLAHAIASALIEADSIREAQREEEEKRNKEQVRKIFDLCGENGQSNIGTMQN